jgi:hypothetical protein
MDAHMKSRLTKILDDEGLDALVASTPENLQYVSGFRSITHALFRGLELYGVFTRRGVGLVIPFIDAKSLQVAARQDAARQNNRVRHFLRSGTGHVRD